MHSVNSASGSSNSGFQSTPVDSVNETYIYHIHGLTQAKCDARALQLWKGLSAREYRGTFVLPVTPALLPNLLVNTKWHVTNTPRPSFRQDHLGMTLTESFSEDDGLTAEILGINHALPQGMA
jgi:hypothetical protein